MQLDPNIHFENEAQRNEYYKIRIDSLDLPKRVESALASASIRTIGGILRHSEEDLLEIRGLGIKGLRYIADKINGTLKMYESVPVGELIERSVVHTSQKSQASVVSVVTLLENEDVIDVFAERLGIKKEKILGKTRKKEVVEVRDIIVFFLREYAQMSFPAIGKLLGGRDHTTIIHAYRKTQAKVELSRDFKEKFPDLVAKSLLIKERKDYIEQKLIPSVIAGIRLRQDAIAPKPKQILPRNLKILELYREGLTLQNIADSVKLSRERIRQVVERTIEQLAINQSISSGVEIDPNVLKDEEKRKRQVLAIPESSEETTRNNEHRWSRYYVECKSCGTTAIPHLRKGLCEQCLGGFRAERREEIIRQHNTCELCARSRAEAVALYGRDFYITKDKRVFCRGCFLKYTGKKLGGYMNHVWSRHHPKCISCGTVSVPYFAKGLCENCSGILSIRKREEVITEHGSKCDECGTERARAKEISGKDLCITKNRNVLCRACFQKYAKTRMLAAARKS